MNDTVVMKPSTTTTTRGKRKSNSRLAEFSDEDDLNRMPAVNTRSKRESRKASQKNETLNVRYFDLMFFAFIKKFKDFKSNILTEKLKELAILILCLCFNILPFV